MCSFAWEKTHHRLLISQWKRSSMSRKSFSIINYFGLLWPYLKIIYPCITDTLPVHSEPPASTSSHWYLGKYMFVIAQQFLSAGWRVSAWWLVTISHDKWKWDREIKLESLSKANSRKYLVVVKENQLTIETSLREVCEWISILHWTTTENLSYNGNWWLTDGFPFSFLPSSSDKLKPFDIWVVNKATF